MNSPKVIIVGGGPAGCAAAYTLAKESIGVTIFERGQPGKDKACGDALLPSAIELISLFGIDQDRIKSLGGYRFDRVNLYIDNLLVRQSVYKNKAGWVIPRAVIDQEIRNITAECTSFQYETCVTDVMIEPTGSLELSVRYKDGTNKQIECDAIVLATGSMNQLSKKFNIEGKPYKAFAISVYAEIHKPNTHVLQIVDSCQPIYWWVFPISEKVANIGVCIFNEKLKVNVKFLVEKFLKEHHANPLGKWRGGWGPLWSGHGQCWNHTAGIVSCGDAAGLINPYTGEGMTAALKSGEQAGKAISSYLLGNRDLRELDKYSEWINEHFSRQYKITPLTCP